MELKIFLDKYDRTSQNIFEVVKFIINILNPDSLIKTEVSHCSIHIGKRDISIYIIDMKEKDWDLKFMGMNFNYMIYSNTLAETPFIKIYRKFAKHYLELR